MSTFFRRNKWYQTLGQSPGPKNKGFTLVELIVIGIIIGIFATILIRSLSTYRAQARDTQRISDLALIRQALEAYHDDYGYYPSLICGWDCSNYGRSYMPNQWDNLNAKLAPYLAAGKLPVDPINSACMPTTDGCYSYIYGNVGRVTYPARYDLIAQLENEKSPYRCELKRWRIGFTNGVACGPYSDYLYSASSN